MNFQNGFNVPILAILCDGKNFYFFNFVDRRRQTRNTSPQLFLGQFADGDLQQSISELLPSTDLQTFMRQIRRTCESFYYIFLSGYRSGLDAYWNRSLERGKSEGKGRISTPGWHKARILAGKALEEAKSAWNLHQDNKLAESRTSAGRAIQFLAERYLSCYLLLAVDANYGFLSTALKKLL